MKPIRLAAGHSSNSNNSQDSLVACYGSRHEYVCDLSHWTSYFPGKISVRMADLLRVAIGIYFSDRLTPRDRRRSECGWSREMRLTVEVQDAGFWSDPSVRSSLIATIDFLSGDYWDIDFVPVSNSEYQRDLPFSSAWNKFSQSPVVCLYSGGLDSAAGLVRCLHCHPDSPMVPVLVRHQPGQGRLVRTQLQKIADVTGRRVFPLILPFRMRTPRALSGSEENTQRTRSFLFCSAAVIAGAMTDATAVQMMEGGIGAYNLPLMSGMLSSKATRSSHPTFLRLFSQLINRVLDRPLTITLPHIDLTKAELASELHDTPLESLAYTTASCVHYPLREQAKQCGVCPACIFRRQALIKAQIQEPRGAYRHDIFSTFDTSADDEEKLIYLKAFLLQIDKLAPLDHSDNLPEFMVRHLRATDVSRDERTVASLADLYRRYRSEWLDLIRKGQRCGWRWSSFIDTTVPC